MCGMYACIFFSIHHICSISNHCALPRLRIWPNNPNILMTLRHDDSNKVICVYLYSVLAVAISSDSQYIVSGSYDDTIKVWDLRTGECLRTIYVDVDFVTSVAISPDGNYIVSGGVSMCMYVCMHVCMYVCMNVIHVCMQCINVCMYVCMCMYACIYACMYARWYHSRTNW